MNHNIMMTSDRIKWMNKKTFFNPNYIQNVCKCNGNHEITKFIKHIVNLMKHHPLKTVKDCLKIYNISNKDIKDFEIVKNLKDFEDYIYKKNSIDDEKIKDLYYIYKNNKNIWSVNDDAYKTWQKHNSLDFYDLKKNMLSYYKRFVLYIDFFCKFLKINDNDSKNKKSDEIINYINDKYDIKIKKIRNALVHDGEKIDGSLVTLDEKSEKITIRDVHYGKIYEKKISLIKFREISLFLNTSWIILDIYYKIVIFTYILEPQYAYLK